LDAVHTLAWLELELGLESHVGSIAQAPGR
jgi:hypothetical protein